MKLKHKKFTDKIIYAFDEVCDGGVFNRFVFNDSRKGISVNQRKFVAE